VRAVTRSATSAGLRFSVVERERGADHLVAGADPERVEDEDEGVRPVRDPHCIGHAEVGGGLLLEGAHLRAEDEPARVDNRPEAILQLLDQGRVLRLDVNVRNGHEATGGGTPTGGPVYRPTPSADRSIARLRARFR
jgi:hypothetical protein